ncbi:MAG TPA: enoyl-CoA hydratase/isomerase family protein [Paenirhodobacter sp.]
MIQNPSNQNPPKMTARKHGRAGWLTFTRPQALNALDGEMAAFVVRALQAWRDDPDVDLVLIDAEGARAFCAGGDIAAVWHAGRKGDFHTGGQFFRDEYRMNAMLAEYPKPVIAFMQGFIMGGGVGVGGHARHRIVGESSCIAMPETGIGLVPDVGGTLILARAPGRIGEYLGTTGSRIGAADAILAGFADHYIPEADWPALKARLAETGDPGVLPPGGEPPPGRLGAEQALIARIFALPDIRAITDALAQTPGDFAAETLTTLRRNSALSEEATLQLVRMTRANPTIREALSNEFRFTLRAAEQGDFMEGVRAQLIDKDRTPQWGWTLATLHAAKLREMLAPLPAEWRIDFTDQA